MEKTHRKRSARRLKRRLRRSRPVADPGSVTTEGFPRDTLDRLAAEVAKINRERLAEAPSSEQSAGSVRRSSSKRTPM